MTRTMMSGFVLAAATAGLMAVASGRSEAAFVTDPAGDFIPSYTAGPKNNDLDVTSVGVTFDGVRFVLTATLSGPLGLTPGALYVWGVDRGAGTARFGAIATGVLFDSVVALQANGTGTVTRILEGTSTALSAGDVMISGNTITATVQASLLPTQGRAASAYTFNLWPRLGSGNNNQISDFAPDNSNIGASAVPEPSSFALCGLASFTGVGAWWRRRRAVAIA